jgi:TonB family protein
MDMAVRVLSPAREGVPRARSDTRAHHRIAQAFLASIILHAAILGLLAVLLTTRRQPPRAHDAYIYLIPVSRARASMDSSLAAANQTPGSSRSKLTSRVARKQMRSRQPFARPATALKPETPAVQVNRTALVPIKSGALTAVVLHFSKPPASPPWSSSGAPRVDRADSDSRAAGYGPVRGGLIDMPPAVLFNPLPIYPDAARQRAIEGEVRLRIIVDQSGRVERDIEVIESIPLLDQAAISAVEQWRFSPGRDRDGHPARTLLEVPVHFTLRNPD